MNEKTIREVVAVFDDRKALETAIEELQSHGIDRRQLSLLANRETVEAQLGEPLVDTRDLMDDPAAPRSAPVELEDQGTLTGMLVGTPAALAGMAAAAVTALSGGALGGVAIAAVAGVGGGGAVGGMFAGRLAERWATYFEEQVERGGILLWVSLTVPEREATVREILARHASGKVQADEIAA